MLSIWTKECFENYTKVARFSYFRSPAYECLTSRDDPGLFIYEGFCQENMRKSNPPLSPYIYIYIYVCVCVCLCL